MNDIFIYIFSVYLQNFEVKERREIWIRYELCRKYWTQFIRHKNL